MASCIEKFRDTKLSDFKQRIEPENMHVNIFNLFCYFVTHCFFIVLLIRMQSIYQLFSF